MDDFTGGWNRHTVFVPKTDLRAFDYKGAGVPVIESNGILSIKLDSRTQRIVYVLSWP